MFRKPLAALCIASLMFLTGCGGGDQPDPNAAGTNGADQNGSQTAAAGGQAQTGGAPGQSQPGLSGPGRTQQASAQRPAGGLARPGGANAAAAGSQALSAVSSGQPIDTSHIPATAVAAIYVRPSQILASPTLASLPQDEMLQDAIDQLGVDPRNIDQVVAAIMFDETDKPEPNTGFIVRFREPYDRERIGGNLFPAENREEVTAGSMTYYQNERVAVSFADDRTVLVFPPEAAKVMLTPASESSPLVQALQAVGGGSDVLLVGKVTDSMKQQIAQQKQQLAMQSPELADLPEHFQTIVLRGSIDPAITLQVGIETDDPQVAQKLVQQTEQGIQMAKQQLAASRDELAQQVPLFGTALVNAADRILAETKPAATGPTFHLTVKAPEQLNQLVPAAVQMVAQQIRAAQGAARAAANLNHLRQIGLALHMHHDQYSKLPSRANFEGDTPLLSWRVHVLPFLGEEALYQQFKLDEPWDSEHNKPLVEQMPDVYASADGGEPSEPGRTRILGVTGQGTILEDPQGTKMTAIADGTSKTLIVVEATPEQAVPWTKPEDLNAADDEALQKLLSAAGNGLRVLFADGRAMELGSGIDLEKLRNLFTMADGNYVELD